MNTSGFRCALALLAVAGILSSSGLASVDLSGPLTDWSEITYPISNAVDWSNDQQAGAEGDFVGDANHACVATQFDDLGTASLTDGYLAFRIRHGEDNTKVGVYDGACFVGIDLDMVDEDPNTAGVQYGIDLFIGVDRRTDKKNPGVLIWAAGSVYNTTPSNTSIGDIYLRADGTQMKWNMDDSSWSTFIAVDLSTDPNGTDTDIDNNGSTDHFLSFQIDFADLVYAAETYAGVQGFNETSSVMYVIASSQNGNGFNQDIAGPDGQTNSSVPWSDLGAISDARSVPEPVSLVSLLVGAAGILLRRKRR